MYENSFCYTIGIVFFLDITKFFLGNTLLFIFEEKEGLLLFLYMRLFLFIRFGEITYLFP